MGDIGVLGVVFIFMKYFFIFVKELVFNRNKCFFLFLRDYEISLILVVGFLLGVIMIF